MQFLINCMFSDASQYFGIGGSSGVFYPRRGSSSVEKIPIVVKRVPVPENTEFILPISVQDEDGNSLQTSLSILTAKRPPQFMEQNYVFQLPESSPVGTEWVLLLRPPKQKHTKPKGLYFPLIGFLRSTNF